MLKQSKGDEDETEGTKHLYKKKSLEIRQQVSTEGKLSSHKCKI